MGAARHVAADAHVVNRRCTFAARQALVRSAAGSGTATGSAFDATSRIRPVLCPIANGPIRLGVGWPTWLVEDQRFRASPARCLAWSTEPLTSDVTMSGEDRRNSSRPRPGTDSDWIVKLIDVYPEKYLVDPRGRLSIDDRGDVTRGTLSQEHRERGANRAGRGRALRDRVRGNDHVFRAGHRIMVQVQSTFCIRSSIAIRSGSCATSSGAGIRFSAGDAASCSAREARVLHCRPGRRSGSR